MNAVYIYIYIKTHSSRATRDARGDACCILTDGASLAAADPPSAAMEPFQERLEWGLKAIHQFIRRPEASGGGQELGLGKAHGLAVRQIRAVRQETQYNL